MELCAFVTKTISKSNLPRQILADQMFTLESRIGILKRQIKFTLLHNNIPKAYIFIPMQFFTSHCAGK